MIKMQIVHAAKKHLPVRVHPRMTKWKETARANQAVNAAAEAEIWKKNKLLLFAIQKQAPPGEACFCIIYPVSPNPSP